MSQQRLLDHSSPVEVGDGHQRKRGAPECIVGKKESFDLSFSASEQAALSDGVSWRVFGVSAFSWLGRRHRGICIVADCRSWNGMVIVVCFLSEYGRRAMRAGMPFVLSLYLYHQNVRLARLVYIYVHGPDDCGRNRLARSWFYTVVDSFRQASRYAVESARWGARIFVSYPTLTSK